MSLKRRGVTVADSLQTSEVDSPDGGKSTEVKLPEVEQIEAEISEAIFSGAKTPEENLTRSKLSDVKLSGPNFDEEKIPGPKLAEVNLPGPKLAEVNLPGPKLSEVTQPGPKLSEVTQPGPKPSEVKLSEVKLPENKLPEVKIDSVVVDSRESSGDSRPVHVTIRRSSSSSTSSFEDITYHVKQAEESKFLEPPNVAIVNEKQKPSLKGALTFKTTSFDDPTYYAQTTSTTSHDVTTKQQTSSRVNGKRFSFGKKKRAATVMATQVQEDRDPENLNEIVMIRFEEVFAEPEGAYSFGTIWGASNRIFSDSKNWCYKFLSALCAVPCSLCWGVNFACLSFCQIWYYQPGVRCFLVQIKPLARIYGVCVKSFIEPCFEAIGRVFGGIRLHLSQE